MALLASQTRPDIRAGTTLPFAPARLDGCATLTRPITTTDVRFQVRIADSEECQSLDGDPNRPQSVPLLRVIVNGAATFVVLLVAGLAVFATAPSALGFKPVVLTSGSMRPTIDVGDVVLTSPTDGHGLGPGAVINYEIASGTRLHRIIGVTKEGYRTAGDANRVADSDLVAPRQIRGTGTLIVPYIGLPSVWIHDKRWAPLVAATIALTSMLYVSRIGWVEPRKPPGV